MSTNQPLPVALLTAPELAHLFDTHVGEATPARPWTYEDWMDFGQAVTHKCLEKALKGMAQADAAPSSSSGLLVQEALQAAIQYGRQKDLECRVLESKVESLTVGMRHALEGKLERLRHLTPPDVGTTWEDQYKEIMETLDAATCAVQPEQTKGGA